MYIIELLIIASLRLKCFLCVPLLAAMPVRGVNMHLLLTLAELHVFVLRSVIKYNNLKASTKFDEALTKPYNGLIEISL